MGGGLLQLVAYGAQDVYLTGNPQITFWKVSYRRYTNFSMEAIQQAITGSTSLGQRCSCQISRNGDLIHRMYLEITTSAGTQANIAHGGAYLFIDNLEVEIGGQLIDRQYGDWMYIWNKLSLPVGKFAGFSLMTFANSSALSATANRMLVPFEFWFCRNPGLALPLIALQYHEVKVNIAFNPSSKLSGTGGANNYSITSAKLWVDYIFLDTDERRRMAQNPHEYLIDQVQFTGENAFSNSIKLNFNHPVKELVWVAQIADAAGNTRFNTYNPLGTCLLQLNGQDRFTVRPGTYFSQTQPYQHHTNIPVNTDFSNTFSTAVINNSSNIHVYSFSLKPEEHQPSGTCNFSRIDSAVLQLTQGTTASTRVRVYAVNYNVLRIMSGMGGLAYSN